MGHRCANLRRALAALAGGVTIGRVSSVYDTAPRDLAEQPRFLNLVCEGETNLSPRELLDFVKRIEGELGRRPEVRYGPRVVDIDILLYDRIVINTPELAVPHPRLAERAFVLAPLAEIAPGVAVPSLGRTVRDLLSDLPDQDVVRVGPLEDGDRPCMR